MLNEDRIVTSAQAESDSVDAETDKDEDNNNENSKGPSNAGAFSTLETAMEWYEQQSVPSYSTTAAQENQRPCSEKRRCPMVQRKIRDYFPQQRCGRGSRVV
ncbi:uncharacterized protein TNCV_3059631 [Trichonephila clavipes]|nr:uncharacterized protein TNCV_3059631 [Trichonephila clavipes]